MAIWTRLRAPILFMRLARWNLTVLRLMWSSSAISALVRPWATVTATSSSRSVSATTGCARSEDVAESAKLASRRGDAGSDEGVALGGGVDGLDQQVWSGVLEKEALDLAQDVGRGREILDAWTPGGWARVW